MQRWPLLLFCFSLVLRFVNLGSDLLWYDEAFTAYITKLPPANMLAAIAGDTHPPLWYLVEWVARNLFGPSELVLRSPSALLGAGAVVTLYQLVKKLAGETAARWSSGLLAVMPAQLYYSQEARMYALLTFLVLLGAEAVHSRRWIRAAIILALIAFTQNLGLIYSGILGAWGLWNSRGRFARYLPVTILAYLPQAITTLKQATNVAEGFWVPDPVNAGGILYSLHFATFFVRIPEPLKTHVMIAFIGVTIVTLYTLHQDWRRALPLAVLAFVPPMILYGASKLWHPVTVDRSMLPAGAALVGLWGMALARAPRWSLKPAGVIGIPILLAGLVSFYADPTNQRTTFDIVPRLIRQRWKSGDAIYHNQFFGLVQYDYYLGDLPAFTLPYPGTLRQGALTNETQDAMGITYREVQLGDLKSRGFKRVWLIADITVVTSDYAIRFSQDAIAAYRVVEYWNIKSTEFDNLTIYLLEL